METAYEFKRETRENSVELWPQRIKDAMEFFQNDKRGWKRWQANIELYGGEHFRRTLGLSDLIKKSDLPGNYYVVPVTASTVNSFVPFLTQNDPNPLVKPNKPESVHAAKINTQLLRHEWIDRKMKVQLKRIVKDSLIFGFGIGYCGYMVDYEEYPEGDEKTGQLNYRLHVTKDDCIYKRIDPFRFLWESDSPDYDLDSARWCDEILFVPRQDVIDDPRYTKEFKKAVQMNAIPAANFVEKIQKTGWNMRSTDLYMDQVILHMIWDKKWGQRHIFCEGVSEPAYKDPQPWPYRDTENKIYLDSFPYKRLDFMSLINEPFAMGLPNLMEDQQLQLNRMRTAEFNHVKKSKRVYWFNTNMTDEDVARKVTGNEDVVAVALTGPGEQAIGVVPDAPISSDFYSLEGIIKQDIKETTGESELQRGGNMPSGTTATEVQARQQVMGLKTSEMSDAINEFVKDCLGIFLKHIIVNFSREKTVRIVGEEGQYWLMTADPDNPEQLIPQVVTAEDVKGDFDLEIESVAGTVEDPEMDKQQRISIMQAALQNGVPVDPIELFRWVLEPFNIKDLSRWFPAAARPPVPVAEAPAMPITTVGLLMQAMMGGGGMMGGQQPNVGPPMNQQQQVNQGAVNPVSNEQGQNGPMGGV